MDEAQVILACISVLIIFTGSRTICRGRDYNQLPFLALKSVLVPTSLSWLSGYRDVVGRMCSARPKDVMIELGQCLQNIKNGTVELRNSGDLAPLLLGKLMKHGHKFSLHINSSWWFSTPRILLATQFNGFKHQEPDSEELRNSTFNSLDQVPYIQLKITFSELYDSLRSGCNLDIDFTAISPDVSYLDPAFILCTVPLTCQIYEPLGSILPRTSTPLMISLHYVLELLMSRPSPFLVDQVKNITDLHISEMKILEGRLVDDVVLRAAVVGAVGMQGWRETRLACAWQTGLLSAGFLQRWRITVTKVSNCS